MSAEIEHLIRQFARLPGMGPRSAKRAVLHLLRQPEAVLAPLIKSLEEAKETITTCSLCGNLDTTEPCGICRDSSRDSHTLCVVEQVEDLWAVERAGAFHGQYHVLGGVMSAINGVHPEDLEIDRLVARVRNNGVQETILALSATVDGQATSHYLAKKLEMYHSKITRLAHGVPVGGSLNYLDDGTLGAALQSRRPLNG